MSAFMSVAVPAGPPIVVGEGDAVGYAVMIAALGLFAWALRLIARG